MDEGPRPALPDPPSPTEPGGPPGIAFPPAPGEPLHDPGGGPIDVDEGSASASRPVAIIAVALVVLVGASVTLGAALVLRDGGADLGALAPDALLETAAAAAGTAGCGAVEETERYGPGSDDVTHVDPAEMPPLSSWPSVPPASGPHAAAPLAAGVYDTPPPVAPLIHALEHGVAVVWLSPDVPSEEVDAIRAFYADPRVGGRVIVAPYDYPSEGTAGRLPGDMSMVSWHRVQTCERANVAAAFGFTARYTAPTFDDEPWLGVAPEPGAPV